MINIRYFVISIMVFQYTNGFPIGRKTKSFGDLSCLFTNSCSMHLNDLTKQNFEVEQTHFLNVTLIEINPNNTMNRIPLVKMNNVMNKTVKFPDLLMDEQNGYDFDFAKIVELISQKGTEKFVLQIETWTKSEFRFATSKLPNISTKFSFQPFATVRPATVLEVSSPSSDVKAKETIPSLPEVLSTIDTILGVTQGSEELPSEDFIKGYLEQKNLHENLGLSVEDISFIAKQKSREAMEKAIEEVNAKIEKKENGDNISFRMGHNDGVLKCVGADCEGTAFEVGRVKRKEDDLEPGNLFSTLHVAVSNNKTSADPNKRAEIRITTNVKENKKDPLKAKRNYFFVNQFYF